MIAIWHDAPVKGICHEKHTESLHFRCHAHHTDCGRQQTTVHSHKNPASNNYPDTQHRAAAHKFAFGQNVVCSFETPRQLHTANRHRNRLDTPMLNPQRCLSKFGTRSTTSPMPPAGFSPRAPPAAASPAALSARRAAAAAPANRLGSRGGGAAGRWRGRRGRFFRHARRRHRWRYSSPRRHSGSMRLQLPLPRHGVHQRAHRLHARHRQWPPRVAHRSLAFLDGSQPQSHSPGALRCMRLTIIRVCRVSGIRSASKQAIARL